MLSAPLLLGADLDKLDEFTLSLLTNDEVLAVDQDSLGKQATRVAGEGDLLVYAKDLDDGSKAVGLFNRSDKESEITAPFQAIGANGKQIVRDLWRQKDLGHFEGEFKTKVAPHGVVFVKVRPL